VKPKKESNTAKPQTLIRWPDNVHSELEKWACRNGLALSTLLAKYIGDRLDDIVGTDFRLIPANGPLGTLAPPMVIPDPGFMKRVSPGARLSKDRVTKNREGIARLRTGPGPNGAARPAPRREDREGVPRRVG
jgi:hypothetical protein